MANKKTLVLGASSNPSRYSYLAINSLQKKNHEVVAIGKRSGKVETLKLKRKREILLMLIPLLFI